MKFSYVKLVFLVLFVMSMIGVFFYNFSLVIPILIVLVFAVTAITLSTNIRWNYFVKGYHSNPKIGEKAVAITFDDGPSEHTLEILDILDQYEIKAVFFCIGSKIDQFPEVFREIIKRGHAVGNHTYSHSRTIGFRSSGYIFNEIEACDKVALEKGNVSLKWFRPPFGIINPKTKRALERSGHTVMGWSVRPYDAITGSTEKVIERITRKLKKGDIILLHDNKSKTKIILEQLLVFLSKNEFYARRADKLLEIEA